MVFENLSIREQMNLSQADLAEYLRVNTSQVGGAEAKTRALPKRTFDKHMLLKMAYVEGIKVIEEDASLPPMTEEDRKVLLKEIGDLQFEKKKLLRNLEVLQDQYKKVKLLYEVCIRLLKRLPDKEDFSYSTITVWLSRCEYRFTECGRLPQARLKLRIEELDRKIAFLEGWLK